MKKAVIISAHPGVGKTMLAQKYRNVLDLESSNYAWIYSEDSKKLSEEQRKAIDDREPNPEWPQNYIKAIRENMPKYDYILIMSSPLVLNCLDDEKISYLLAFPSIDSEAVYMKRYRERGNNARWLGRFRKVFKTYVRQKQRRKNCEKIVLHGDETLEDYFVRNGFRLVEK